MFRRKTQAVPRHADDLGAARLVPVPARKGSLPSLATLEDVLDSGTAVPFTNRMLVDRDYFQDALDQLQADLPSALTRAEAIVRDEESIRSRAEADAKRMVSRAESQVAAMVSEKGLLKEAEAERERIIREAKNEAQEITESARKYVDDLLRKAERSAEDALTELRKVTTLVKTRP